MLKFLDRKKLQILFFSDFNPDSMIFLLNLFAKFKEFSSERKASTQLRCRKVVAKIHQTKRIQQQDVFQKIDSGRFFKRVNLGQSGLLIHRLTSVFWH